MHKSGSIKLYGGLSRRNDSVGFSSLLLSDLGQVLDEVALGDLVENSNNGGVLADGGDSVVARRAHILDVITLVLMDSVELCHVNLAAGDVLEKLGLSRLVGLINLSVNLLLGFFVNSIDSLLLSRGVVEFEASIAVLNAFDKLSETETGTL